MKPSLNLFLLNRVLLLKTIFYLRYGINIKQLYPEHVYIYCKVLLPVKYIYFILFSKNIMQYPRMTRQNLRFVGSSLGDGTRFERSGRVKGSVSRDFLPPFFMIRTHLGACSQS